MTWVIDTSALIRLFVPDGPLCPEVETAFNRAASGAEWVLAPHLLLVEAANVLLRKHRRGELSLPEMHELLGGDRSRYRFGCVSSGPLLSAACTLGKNP